MTTSTPIALSTLSATRRARAGALLTVLERHGSMTLWQVTAQFITSRRHEPDAWTRGQLDKAIDDLAGAGSIDIQSDRYGGLTLIVVSQAVGS